ncbi:hypothetical protein RRG08_043909 [Elysia crispata]|uniref:Uncharacterized protein n=1 Tax=Elysia crispata TaxID=231223 RepID=A0AAE1APU0_9GAST|nr:hypothetical protein RRG08_043909 [Elysia crispata]
MPCLQEACVPKSHVSTMPGKRGASGLGRNSPDSKRLRLNRHANGSKPPEVGEAVDENVINSLIYSTYLDQ